MIGSLIQNIHWSRWIKDTAAGTDASAAASSAIDCGAFDRAMVTLELGTVTDAGNLTLKLQECDSAGGTYTDIAGANLGASGMVLTGKSDKSIVIDAQVSKRYLKVVYQRTAANIQFDGGMAVLYNGKAVPPPRATDVIVETVV